MAGLGEGSTRSSGTVRLRTTLDDEDDSRRCPPINRDTDEAGIWDLISLDSRRITLPVCGYSASAILGALSGIRSCSCAFVALSGFGRTGVIFPLDSIAAGPLQLPYRSHPTLRTQCLGDSLADPTALQDYEERTLTAESTVVIARWIIELCDRCPLLDRLVLELWSSEGVYGECQVSSVMAEGLRIRPYTNGTHVLCRARYQPFNSAWDSDFSTATSSRGDESVWSLPTSSDMSTSDLVQMHHEAAEWVDLTFFKGQPPSAGGLRDLIAADGDHL